MCEYMKVTELCCSLSATPTSTEEDNLVSSICPSVSAPPSIRPSAHLESSTERLLLSFSGGQIDRRDGSGAGCSVWRSQHRADGD